jgi:hypothetical protein
VHVRNGASEPSHRLLATENGASLAETPSNRTLSRLIFVASTGSTIFWPGCATNTKDGGIISNCPCPTGVGVGDGLGVGHGVGVRVGVAVGDGVAVGVEGGDGVAVGVEVGDGDGDGEAGTARTLKPFESLDGLYWAVPAKFALSVTVPAPPAVI